MLPSDRLRKIEIGAASNVHRTPWAAMIKAAKAALPCWNVDTQVIWEAFRTFNRAKGNSNVLWGYLLGFMRKWRCAGAAPMRPRTEPFPEAKGAEVAALIRHVPLKNWRFHERYLQRIIGMDAHDERVRAMQAWLGEPFCFGLGGARRGRDSRSDFPMMTHFLAAFRSG